MGEMGTFRTIVGVENVSQQSGIRELPETMVDTGSEFTWIPRTVLESLDIKVHGKNRLILVFGRPVERKMENASFHPLGFATPDDGVFAEADDLILPEFRPIE